MRWGTEWADERGENVWQGEAGEFSGNVFMGLFSWLIAELIEYASHEDFFRRMMLSEPWPSSFPL